MELLTAFIFGAKLHYSAPVVIDPIREQMVLLALCESGNDPKAINYNDGGEGKHSRGTYQLQTDTARDFAKAYNYPAEITDENIYDETLQKVLTYRALKDKQYWRWENCSRQYGWL